MHRIFCVRFLNSFPVALPSIVLPLVNFDPCISWIVLFTVNSIVTLQPFVFYVLPFLSSPFYLLDMLCCSLFSILVYLSDSPCLFTFLWPSSYIFLMHIISHLDSHFSLVLYPSLPLPPTSFSFPFIHFLEAPHHSACLSHVLFHLCLFPFVTCHGWRSQASRWRAVPGAGTGLASPAPLLPPRAPSFCLLFFGLIIYLTSLFYCFVNSPLFHTL